MKILFVIAHIGKGGGEAIQSCNIIREIEKQGHECNLLTLKTLENLVEEPCRTEYVGDLKFPRGILDLKKKITEIGDKFDVIQCFDYNFSLPATYFSWKRPFFLRIGMNPYKEFINRKQFLYYPILRIFFPIMIRSMSRLIVNSEFLLGDFDKFEPTHIPNGYDVKKFSPIKNKNSLRRELKLDNDRTLLLYTGKVIPRKNLEVVFEALKDLEDVYFVILGNYKEEHYGDRYYNHLIDKYKEEKDKFTFLGEKKPKDVIKYLCASDVFVFPSILEGTPNSVIEAMLTGLPVICSDIDNHRLIIDDRKTGFLYKERGDLVNKINLLKDPKLRQTVGEKAKKYAISNHDIKNVAKKYLDIYREGLK